ncbi:type II toxin-antitoxin system RelE/ParE family toxin [Desulfovibrio sp. OttesenSCG-928-C06]|nr:type II toxin-antitoxin system RelE/ParE family toxin [Desulfovibrio sp. OttesenSCG-928-C06]
MRIRWLKKALQNFDSAMAFIAQEDEEAARSLSAYILERINSLGVEPAGAGQGRPGRIFGTRELVIDNYPYIVPYRVKNNEIQILRIFHTSRKPPERW